MCVGPLAAPSLPSPLSTSSPAASPTPPQAPQPPNIADLAAVRKQRMAASGIAGGVSGMGAGSLLTGATGIENNQLNSGRGSLLGS